MKKLTVRFLQKYVLDEFRDLSAGETFCFWVIFDRDGRILSETLENDSSFFPGVFEEFVNDAIREAGSGVFSDFPHGRNVSLLPLGLTYSDAVPILNGIVYREGLPLGSVTFSVPSHANGDDCFDSEPAEYLKRFFHSLSFKDVSLFMSEVHPKLKPIAEKIIEERLKVADRGLPILPTGSLADAIDQLKEHIFWLEDYGYDDDDQEEE